jgi:hypothetical protein
MVAYIKDRLGQAGEEGLERDPLETNALKAVGSRSRSGIYAVRLQVAKDVVEFKEDPDDLASPIRWRLKNV